VRHPCPTLIEAYFDQMKGNWRSVSRGGTASGGGSSMSRSGAISTVVSSRGDVLIHIAGGAE